MKKVIVVNDLKEQTIEMFRGLTDYDFTFVREKKDLTDEMLKDCEVFVGSVNPDIVSKAPKLKWIQLFSAGAAGYQWLPEDVMVTNAYGAYGEIIAEYILTAALMIMKKMPDYLENQKKCAWDLLNGIQRVSASTFLSVGMGQIGTAFLKKASALGGTCYGVRRSIHDKPDFIRELYTTDNMKDILGSCDVVALSLPGTSETDNLFDEKMMRQMKPGSILINVGRGNSIVTDDLIKLAKEGYFKGVVLDVTDPEPLPKNHELWHVPNVYITPHVSGGYREGVNYDSVISVIYNNLKNVAEGKQPAHIVDKQIGY